MDFFALLAQKVDHQFRVMDQCLSFFFEGIHHVERVTYKNEAVRYIIGSVLVPMKWYSILTVLLTVLYYIA